MLEDRLTMAPPAGAGPFNVMVRTLLDPAATLLGAIVMDCSVGRGVAWQMFEGIETIAVLESVVPTMFFARTK